MGYEAANDSYISQDSGVLYNRLEIDSEGELLEAEAEITAVESGAILFESDLTHVKFDSELLRKIHEQLFERIYEWAGQYRTIDMQKGAAYFAHASYISPQLEDLMRQLANEGYLQGLSKEDFTKGLAHYYSELNVIHPFREGNGRTIRLFLTLLAYKAGWTVAWDAMDPQVNIQVCEAAFLGDEQQMCDMLSPMIEKLTH